MPCDYPIKCRWWDEEKKRCVALDELFEKGPHPCEVHQRRIDYAAAREVAEALRRKDYETAEAIAHSPFVSWAWRRGDE